MDKVETRRQAIIDLLKEAPMIPVSEMANSLNVTTETIRKDLGALEQQGLIVKIRGGAALAKKGAPIPYAQREAIGREDKRHIARAAVKLISKDNTLILEGSTTTSALCQELTACPELLKTLTIITNSIHVAEAFDFGAMCANIFLLGGRLEPKERVTQWAFISKYLEYFHVDMAFLSAAALDSKLQFSTYYERDMIFQQAAMDSAEKTVFMVDKSKFSISAIYKVSRLDAVDFLVTNIDLDERELQLLAQNNVQLVQAE